MWHVSVEGGFQFSLFDNRTRIQAYSALRVLHHPAPGWNCVTATTNTNSNPETNPNIHPPSLTSHPTYPRPPTCLQASSCCQQCGRYKTHGVPTAQAYRNKAHLSIQLYRVAQKVGWLCLIGHISKRLKPIRIILSYFNIVLYLNTVTWCHMTDNEQVRRSCDSNKEQIALYFAMSPL